MKAVKDIIKEKRLEHGLTMKELAQKVGVSEGTISRWESGEIANMRRSAMVSLSKALDIAPAVLMGWSEPLPDGAFRPALKRVPMLGYAAAGEPLENLDGQDTYYVEADSKYKVDFCITVRGDSMINAGINDGDIVFVHRQPDVKNGQVACVEINRNQVAIKRFYKTGNGVMLVSENPKYAPLIFNADNCDDFRVLGRAVIKQSEIH